MKRQSAKLRPIALTEDILLEVSYLTGQKYWHQTIFCAYSLAVHLQGKVAINIYSDGTLSARHIALFNKVLKNVNIIDPAAIQNQLEEFLPQAEFPALRLLRGQNAFFRKLVDMRLNKRYIVQLDSDMLFFGVPQALVDAYNTKKYYFMQDTVPSFYVLQEDELSRDLNIQIREKINSGILAYNSADIDWHFVERTCKYLLAKVQDVQPPVFEQTINAIIISQLKGEPLPLDYRIFYANVDDHTLSTDIVRHYIFKAKLEYFSFEWKKILN